MRRSPEARNAARIELRGRAFPCSKRSRKRERIQATSFDEIHGRLSEMRPGGFRGLERVEPSGMHPSAGPDSRRYRSGCGPAAWSRAAQSDRLRAGRPPARYPAAAAARRRCRRASFRPGSEPARCVRRRHVAIRARRCAARSCRVGRQSAVALDVSVADATQGLIDRIDAQRLGRVAGSANAAYGSPAAVNERAVTNRERSVTRVRVVAAVVGRDEIRVVRRANRQGIEREVGGSRGGQDVVVLPVRLPA